MDTFDSNSSSNFNNEERAMGMKTNLHLALASITFPPKQSTRVDIVRYTCTHAPDSKIHGIGKGVLWLPRRTLST